MNSDLKKKLIILVIICIFLIVTVFVICSNKKKVETKNVLQGDNVMINENIQIKTNDDGTYDIYNKKNNQVITKVESESELKKYQENPNYDEFAPKIPE